MSTSKLAYILPRMNLQRTPMIGVRKKIEGQLEALRSHGFEVVLIDTPEATHLDRTASRDSSWIKSVSRKLRSVSWLLEKTRDAECSVLYVRHTITTPGLIYFYFRLRLLRNVKRIYLEIPTWPYRAEATGYRSDAFLSPLIRFIAYRIVTFSGASRIFGVRTINISNGITANDLALLPIPPRNHERMKIVCVAQFHIWSGIDRLIRGVAEFIGSSAGSKTVEVSIAGEGIKFNEWRELAKDLGVDSVVTFHGVCEGMELEQLFEDAHIAIGNLGNHRRGLESNADLKNREYCARGLPFVITASDPALPDDFPYVEKIPADESPLDIKRLFKFYDALCKSHPGYNEEMRQFAVSKLDWKVCMQSVAADIN